MTVPNVQYPIVVTARPTIWRGDPLVLQLSLPNPDGSANDLTAFGSAWAATLRMNMDDPDDEAVSFTVDAGHAAADAGGYIELRLDGTQTRALLGERYGFDVQASGGAESPFTVWTGSLPVDGDYTH